MFTLHCKVCLTKCRQVWSVPWQSMKQQYCSKQQPPTSLQGRYWTVTRRLSGTEHNKPGKSVPSFPDSIYIEFWSFLSTVPPVSPDWPGLQSADSPPVQCLYQWPVSDWNINWKCWQGTQNCWMVWSDTVLITFYCYQSNTTSNSPTSFFSWTVLYSWKYIISPSMIFFLSCLVLVPVTRAPPSLPGPRHGPLHAHPQDPGGGRLPRLLLTQSCPLWDTWTGKALLFGSSE